MNASHARCSFIIISSSTTPTRHQREVESAAAISTARCKQTAESRHLHEHGRALLHCCSQQPASISAWPPQIKSNKNARFCGAVFLFVRCAETGKKKQKKNPHTSTSVTGGEAGRRRRSGAYLKNAQSVAGPLVVFGSLVGLTVSTGGHRNARLLHRQSGQADIRRTLGALGSPPFSPPLSLYLSPLRRCSEARARYL